MIKLKLKPLLQARGIKNPHTWLKGLGITHNIAQKLLSNKQQKIDRKHIELICLHAYCTPNDLFFWQPDGKAADITNHPMQQLRNPTVVNLIAKIKEMPLDKMTELYQQMEEIEKKQNRKS